jgi:hypothetical protein
VEYGGGAVLAKSRVAGSGSIREVSAPGARR